ncbi:folate family ECF transporter S component [Wansuia hejianensis]|uniref:Folate family ECF transporter S component n=1 Tax=Wansuia hejianensis TaxID=2763667 RepID=A0A926EU58_9FIRM|nr:folate family ECF transporter S component [Wansuia hejianensis]MBC8589848.1 folate family ECF transporter S component [Wansuia hejianensis]
MKKLDVKVIVISGFLIALNVVLSRIITIPGVISFGGFPIIFGGIVFGPIAGFIIGAVGDIVSFMVRPTGPFMPHFVLTSALTGFIPGILTIVLKNKLEDFKLWKAFIAILVGQVITSVLMVPYFRLILFDHPFVLTISKAASKQAINIPTYAVMIKILVQSLYKAGTLQES